jgi:hypothetical protein
MNDIVRNQNNASAMQARCDSYNFAIEHTNGKETTVADAFARSPEQRKHNHRLYNTNREEGHLIKNDLNRKLIKRKRKGKEKKRKGEEKKRKRTERKKKRKETEKDERYPKATLKLSHA